ncbi:MAG: hypothetical protein IIC75_04705 [Bacteroidetes bacterium]|nr:hypothetical protein [Bacteroidota bacterium]
MNYKKGFFRITFVLSSITLLFGLIIGINQFTRVYKVYNSKVISHNNYQKDMLNLLNNKKDEIVILGFGGKKFKHPIVIENEAEKFQIKKELIKNIYLDSTNNGEYISIKKIIDSGINKKLDSQIKNKISSQYANTNINISFPWKDFFFYIFLIPLLLGSIIWLIYYIAKYIIIGFQS